MSVPWLILYFGRVCIGGVGVWWCSVWNNSLGLISDSAHMLLDCAALGIGLYGSFMAQWRSNRVFSYGCVLS